MCAQEIANQNNNVNHQAIRIHKSSVVVCMAISSYESYDQATIID